MNINIRNIVLILCALSFGSAAQVLAVYIDGFPEQCSEATLNSELDGHILRLGVVQIGENGPVFSFPDQGGSSYLQQVPIASNAGRIGQNSYRRYRVISPTRSGYFAVAQIFVGDEEQEPVVTCLSRNTSFTRYEPSLYGAAWTWLDRDEFIYRLSRKNYRKWNWRSHWGHKFSDIRSKFKRSNRYDRWKRRDGDRIRDRKRDSGPVVDIKPREKSTPRFWKDSNQDAVRPIVKRLGDLGRQIGKSAEKPKEKIQRNYKQNKDKNKDKDKDKDDDDFQGRRWLKK